jgi:hypothetical protein
VAELILSNGAYVLPAGNPAGNVNANFGHNWSFGAIAGGTEVDFTSTMIHELGHALGFSSAVAQNGGSAFGVKEFTPFDEFLSDGTGTAVVSLALPTGTGPTWTAASIGGTGTVPATPNSGLYFKGTNAVAANGGNLVPLFSPTTWSGGSSGSHMDDAFYVGGNKQLMNSATGNGPGIRTFSPLEVGIFKDIGYTTFGIPEPTSTVLFGLGVLMMFRRHRAAVL